MSKYQSFIFESYHFDKQSKWLELQYSLDSQQHFTERYHFDFNFVDYSETVLDRAIQLLFFMAGVSYYKPYIPPKIIIKAGSLDELTAAFFSKTYQRGLGEFWYVNNLDPHTPVTFPVTTASFELLPAASARGLLIGIGGGKDSLVSVELLRDTELDFATWSLNHRPQLTPLVERIGLLHYWVEREFDEQLLTLKNTPGVYNGHIPISAIIACVGTIVAILSGKQDIVVSNEQSTNEPNVHYQGVAINHQYSKSLEFEQDFQELLRHCFGGTYQYYSLLRPLSELYIAKLFAKQGFEKYKDVFSSCNRAFVHGSNHIFWDGTCPKCAFVFVALTPFIERSKLEALFSGKNLLLDPALETTYRQLLGIEGIKPLECVGEIKESRAAMKLAQQVYPELAKYSFELPDNYDYTALGASSMPDSILQQLNKQLSLARFN